jgi:CspA family cold shock protein
LDDDAVHGSLEELAALPVEPARVKWFDKGKGFGFANVFGRTEDVFVHIEVLRHSGFADLQAGEAVGLRIVDGKRGRMAVQVVSWDSALRG